MRWSFLSLGVGMGRRKGGYRTGASTVCAEKLWRRLAKSVLAALIVATTPTGALASAAQECAASMARRDHLDHNGFKSRAKRYGLRAENVAYGCATEECARARWLKPGSRAEHGPAWFQGGRVSAEPERQDILVHGD